MVAWLKFPRKPVARQEKKLKAEMAPQSELFCLLSHHTTATTGSVSPILMPKWTLVMLQYDTLNSYTWSGVYLVRFGHLIHRSFPVSRQFSSLLSSSVWMLWMTCPGRLGASSCKVELSTSYLFSTILTKWESWPIHGFWSTNIALLAMTFTFLDQRRNMPS